MSIVGRFIQAFSCFALLCLVVEIVVLAWKLAFYLIINSHISLMCFWKFINASSWRRWPGIFVFAYQKVIEHDL